MAYSREIADEICAALAEGRTLREVCRTRRAGDPSFPAAPTVRWWVVNDNDGFAERYARAREAQAEAWSDEIVEIADTPAPGLKITTKADGSQETVTGDMVDRAKLQMDSRKWLMARLHPAKFGDRVAVQPLGKDGKPTDPPPHQTIDLATMLAGWTPPEK